ncbi:hypothetical protein FJY69_01200 [candidate division WOR-3 bacterium]|nr:hypothetical protein [candidate division WOR-3 bacterium]
MRKTTLAIIILLTLAAAASAQPTEFPGYDAALRALDVTNRNLSRWFLVVIVVLILAVLVAVWRIWVYGSRLSEIENVRAVWDKRFNDLSDELLRAKRKTTENEQALAQARAEIAALRNGPHSGPTEADISRLENDLAVARQRLDELDSKAAKLNRELASLDTHAGEVAEGLKAVATVRGQAEVCLARAGKTLEYVQALDSLRAGDDAFALRDHAAAVAAYSRWLDGTQKRDDVDPRLRFRVRHNRAVANLRLGRFDDALDDAAQIEALPELGPKARGAARLLAAVARLNQGLVDQALEEFSRAVEADAFVSRIVLDDEDIKAWAGANPKQATKLMRRLRRLPREVSRPPGPEPAPQAAARPVARTHIRKPK